MLVLTRQVGDSIVINGNITIVVLEIRGGSAVRLGIEAPREITIHRKEVHDRNQEGK